MMKPKSAKESSITATEVVCPNGVNAMHILQGGRMVQCMDLASAICAQNHAENICVTDLTGVSMVKPNPITGI
jgi:acyl-CoA hydrolase